MEQQVIGNEISEGNKLIAFFMGSEWQKGKNLFYKGGGFCDIFPNGNHYARQDQLSYHSSWDWLKPVVDEIFTYSLAHPEQVEKIRNISIVVEIKPCWEKCVEFIKWLNNHNSQTK